MSAIFPSWWSGPKKLCRILICRRLFNGSRVCLTLTWERTFIDLYPKWPEASATVMFVLFAVIYIILESLKLANVIPLYFVFKPRINNWINIPQFSTLMFPCFFMYYIHLYIILYYYITNENFKIHWNKCVLWQIKYTWLVVDLQR